MTYYHIQSLVMFLVLSNDHTYWYDPNTIQSIVTPFMYHTPIITPITIIIFIIVPPLSSISPVPLLCRLR